MIEKAKKFAARAHAGQCRKYSREPYIEHPLAVSDIVAQVCPDPEVIAAAILHDTVEDTSVVHAELEKEFGRRVARLVYEVTDVSKPEDGNRKKRKAMDRAHIAEASPEAQTIKLADLIHNAGSIMHHDPGFARIYMQEKRELLEVLVRGDTNLYERARKIVEDYFGELS